MLIPCVDSKYCIGCVIFALYIFEQIVANCFVNYDIGIIIKRNNVLGNFIQNIYLQYNNRTNFATLWKIYLTPRNK